MAFVQLKYLQLILLYEYFVPFMPLLYATNFFLWRSIPTRIHAALLLRQTNTLGLLCTSDQLVAEAATYTTHTRHEYPCPQRDSNPRSQQSSGRYDHTYRGAGRVINTTPDSGKMPVVHTGTACLAERRLVSKPHHQLPLCLFRR